jgi:hypothetical protein
VGQHGRLPPRFPVRGADRQPDRPERADYGSSGSPVKLSRRPAGRSGTLPYQAALRAGPVSEGSRVAVGRDGAGRSKDLRDSWIVRLLSGALERFNASGRRTPRAGARGELDRDGRQLRLRDQLDSPAGRVAANGSLPDRPKVAIAIPSRCFKPSENAPTRLREAGSSPTSRRVLSMRRLSNDRRIRGTKARFERRKHRIGDLARGDGK